ncbi:hypothetical protein D0T87_10865 [Bacteroides sp. 51]|nr:hypothetical protein [Bacteroides sp. 51]
MTFISSVSFSQKTTTQNLQEQCIATYQEIDFVPNGSYKLTQTLKSNNGGARSTIINGRMKNGKKIGVWTGTISFSNWINGNSIAITGNISFKRSYSESNPGVMNGSFSYIQNTTEKKASYSYIYKKWEYTPHNPGTTKTNITFSMINGLLDGKLFVSDTRFGNNYNASFKNGVQVGTSESVTKLGYKYKYEFDDNGYVRRFIEMKPEGWGNELNFTDEDIQNKDQYEIVKVKHGGESFPYFTYYMNCTDIVSYFMTEVIGSNTSDDKIDNSCYYYVLEVPNNKTLIGNVPQHIIDQLERNKETAKEQKDINEALEYWKKIKSQIDTADLSSFDNNEHYIKIDDKLVESAWFVFTRNFLYEYAQDTIFQTRHNNSEIKRFIENYKDWLSIIKNEYEDFRIKKNNVINDLKKIDGSLTNETAWDYALKNRKYTGKKNIRDEYVYDYEPLKQNIAKRLQEKKTEMENELISDNDLIYYFLEFGKWSPARDKFLPPTKLTLEELKVYQKWIVDKKIKRFEKSGTYELYTDINKEIESKIKNKYNINQFNAGMIKVLKLKTKAK